MTIATNIDVIKHKSWLQLSREKIRALSENFEADILTSVTQLTALKEEWQQLEEHHCAPYQVFQSFNWCQAWAATYTEKQHATTAPFIVTLRNHGRLVMVWPLMRERSFGACILHPLSEPFAQYSDAIIASNIDRDKAMDLAWKHIQTHACADLLIMRHIRQDAIIHDYFKKNAIKWGQQQFAPYLDLTTFPDHSSYEGRYSKSQRRRRKRIRENLEKIGPLHFSCDSGKTIPWRNVKQAIYEKRTWLSQRGLYSIPLSDPNLEQFLNHFNTLDDKGCKLVVSTVHAGDRPISFEIGFRFKNHHFGFITAHDQQLTDNSPGRLHMDLSQRQAITDGIKYFDLMVPASPHKQSWSNGVIPVNDFYAPLSLRGRIYGKIYLGSLREMQRAIYLASPPLLRRQLTRLASMG